MHRFPRSARIGAVVALASLSGVLAPAGAAVAVARSAARPAAKVSPGHWVQVTQPLANVPIIPEVGLVRGSDGVLHVLWHKGTSPHYSVLDTAIASSGAVRAPVTVVRNWFSVDSPAAASTPSGLAVVWNGTRDSGDQFEGTIVATRPRSGGHWSAAAELPGLRNSPQASPAAATAGSDGKLFVASYATDSLVVDHVGHKPVEIDQSGKCCFYNAALATDSSSHLTWVGYMSLVSHDEGVFVRPLRASGAPAGPARLLPGSRAKGNTVPTAERVALTARPGRSGVFAAYGAGLPVLQQASGDRGGRVGTGHAGSVHPGRSARRVGDRR